MARENNSNSGEVYSDYDATVREVYDRLLAPGTQVGDYVIGQPLGEGGFGTVYSAAHPLIGKRAAVKVLNKDLSDDKEIVARFVAEARAVNTIRHQNIVDIFNIGSLDDGRHYFVMELLDGKSLEDVLVSRHRVAPGELIDIMRGISAALHAAHVKGIVHRDVKPDNIFLHIEPGGTMTPKLVDFGVAKLTGESKGLSHHQTSTGTPIGTPRYMSPEQCFARDIDLRTDIYALGVVCFEALTGFAPFDAESLLELMNMHTAAPRPNASSKCEELGTYFDEPLKRMMAIDMFDRPSTTVEAFQSLEAALRNYEQRRVPGMDTPTALVPLPTNATPMHGSHGHGSPPDPARRSSPQFTTPMQAPDGKKTAAWAGSALPAPPLGAATTPVRPRAPTTLGATSSGLLASQQRTNKRRAWLIAALALLSVAGIVLVFSLASETDPRADAEQDRVETAAAPPIGATEPAPAVAQSAGAPTASVSVAPTASVSVAPIPSASNSSKTKTKTKAKPKSKARRRRQAAPPPVPPPPPAAPKPKPDPYGYQ